ncbi:hypothetical protein [Streptomyces cavernae]|uniref:hypothetical protein n=1 Tax=Streptomyces cavernae TaxID=2259034 RepID=UPI000FEBF408
MSSYANQARASAELLAPGQRHLRTGAAENRRGQGLGLTIAPVQATISTLTGLAALGLAVWSAFAR